MIPAFWSIYGWTFGSCIVMACAVCFIAVLEAMDRMNPVFDKNNSMYNDIRVQTEDISNRMIELFHGNAYDGFSTITMSNIHTHNHTSM